MENAVVVIASGTQSEKVLRCRVMKQAHLLKSTRYPPPQLWEQFHRIFRTNEIIAGGGEFVRIEFRMRHLVNSNEGLP